MKYQCCVVCHPICLISFFFFFFFYQIAAIKVAAARMGCDVIDRAIQVREGPAYWEEMLVHRKVGFSDNRQSPQASSKHESGLRKGLACIMNHRLSLCYLYESMVLYGLAF